MEEKSPYFSIILPIYNVEAYLRDCVASVLSQDYKDYELILVDDGALDGSPAICDEYAAEYGNVKVIHKKNGGLSSARNAGMEIAEGMYIWWVDSDDWIEAGALRRLWELCRDEGPDIVKFSYCRTGESTNTLEHGLRPGVYRKAAELEVLKEQAFFHAGRFCLSAWSHVYKRDWLFENQLKFVSERLVGSEDYLFNLQALSAADSVLVLQQPLYWYRVREGSLSQTYKKDLAKKYTELYRLLLEAVSAAGSEKEYVGKINTFYVWHLIRGTCMSGEYELAACGDGIIHRRRVKELLNSKTVQTALGNMDIDGFDWKMRLQRMAMCLKCEPFFYWLYVKKKKKRKTR